MTTLRIEDRKNTTEAGLEALKELMKSFDFEGDIETVAGDMFGCVGDIGGDQKYVWTDNAELRIEDGKLTLCGWGELYGYQPEEIPFGRIQKINFQGAIKSLESAIINYNKLTKEKDVQIKNFLKFCTDYKA